MCIFSVDKEISKDLKSIYFTNKFTKMTDFLNAGLAKLSPLQAK